MNRIINTVNTYQEANITPAVAEGMICMLCVITGMILVLCLATAWVVKQCE